MLCGEGVDLLLLGKMRRFFARWLIDMCGPCGETRLHQSDQGVNFEKREQQIQFMIIAVVEFTGF